MQKVPVFVKPFGGVGSIGAHKHLCHSSRTSCCRVHQRKVAVKTEKIEKFGPVAITTRDI